MSLNETTFLDIFENDLSPTLRQGDIFRPEVVPMNEDMNYIVGWILLNADCDVFRPEKVNFYILAAVNKFSYFLKSISSSKNKISALIHEKIFEMHFIPPDAILCEEGSYIEFGFLQPISASFIHQDDQGNEIKTYDYLMSKRIRTMKHPWRVRLAYRVANYFGRPGTPDHNKESIKYWIEEKVSNY